MNEKEREDEKEEVKEDEMQIKLEINNRKDDRSIQSSSLCVSVCLESDSHVYLFLPCFGKIDPGIHESERQLGFFGCEGWRGRMRCMRGRRRVGLHERKTKDERNLFIVNSSIS